MFFVTGLLLAFTPCVLPMVPILSGIIVGAGGDRPVSRGRAFSLSLAYVLGMALTYTIAGAVFARAGQQAQAFFQKPWMILLFAALFIVAGAQHVRALHAADAGRDPGAAVVDEQPSEAGHAASARRSWARSPR